MSDHLKEFFCIMAFIVGVAAIISLAFATAAIINLYVLEPKAYKNKSTFIVETARDLKLDGNLIKELIKEVGK